MLKLVGDNPFQGVSHLSGERAKNRGDNLTNPKYCAGLVIDSVANGADGFMFTLNDKTLAILKEVRKRKTDLQLYPLVPDIAGFVRRASQGGMVGLAKNIVLEVLLSKNVNGIANGVKGVVLSDVRSIFKSYLSYEVSRVGKVESLLLHEVLTDMALALDMKWLFVTAIEMKCGFETRNFTYLVSKFKEWGISLKGVVIAAPFNQIGFQMCPNREANEETLKQIPEAKVIAFSILAAGYIRINEAVKYLGSLPNFSGVAVGVSNQQQAHNTFSVLTSEELGGE